MSPSLIISVMVLCVVIVGIVLRTLSNLDKVETPDDDDAGFEHARSMANKHHKEREQKIERILATEDPEDALADEINLDGGPL